MHSTCGIILRREDFRERDERITLYTRDFGKISVIAKGLKRIEAKLRGNLDIFNFVDIIFVEGKNFYILTGVDLKERFFSIIKDNYIYGSALSVVRTVEYIYEEDVRDKEFFENFLFTVRKLGEYFSGREGSQPSVQSGLYSWFLLKKFQMVILENQGYSINSKNNENNLSKNSTVLLKMLKGGRSFGVRLSKKDFLDIEEFFIKKFAYLFNYKVSSWASILEK
jgi:recombinational DNA repair protein (RecF pathway)